MGLQSSVNLISQIRATFSDLKQNSISSFSQIHYKIHIVADGRTHRLHIFNIALGVGPQIRLACLAKTHFDRGITIARMVANSSGKVRDFRFGGVGAGAGAQFVMDLAAEQAWTGRQEFCPLNPTAQYPARTAQNSRRRPRPHTTTFALSLPKRACDFERVCPIKTRPNPNSIMGFRRQRRFRPLRNTFAPTNHAFIGLYFC